MTKLSRNSGTVTILPVVALLVTAVLGLLVSPSAVLAEPLDLTNCFSGTGTFFHDSKAILPVVSWVENGIMMSNHENKLLHDAVFHGEGVQRGLGEERKGYGLYTIRDADGDIIIAEAPYSGMVWELKLLEGTGKWKGIKGSLESRRVVYSKPGKGAMPGTYQGCRRWKGTFELQK